MSLQPNVLILGIGNLLWADEGFGVRAIEEFHRLYETPDNVKLMDGGTQGIYLVQHVRDCDILIVFDAVDYGLAPGTIKRVEDEEVPKFMGCKKISLHPDQQQMELDDFGGGLRDEKGPDRAGDRHGAAISGRNRHHRQKACSAAAARKHHCLPGDVYRALRNGPPKRGTRLSLRR